MADEEPDISQNHAFDFAPQVLRSYVWLAGVVAIPFLILVVLSGWGIVFQSGDASAFICGVVIASIAENAIGRMEKHSIFPIGPQEIMLIISIAVLPTIFLIWNGYFAVVDKTLEYPSVDWVQILAFFVAVFYLPFVRGLGAVPPRSGK